MTDNQIKNRLKDLKSEISALNTKINAKETEIQNLILENGADFENSFVCFDNGTNYVFMNVEHQIIRENGSTIVLIGPSLTLSDNPLHFQGGEEGIDFGIYKEEDEIVFSTRIFEGVGNETISIINSYDMSFVADYYFRMVKENLLRGIYNKK